MFLKGYLRGISKSVHLYALTMFCTKKSKNKVKDLVWATYLAVRRYLSYCAKEISTASSILLKLLNRSKDKFLFL
jgi:hypothetical protein